MQKVILAIAAIPVFLISDCFEKKADDSATVTQYVRFENLYRSTEKYLSDSKSQDTTLFLAKEIFVLAQKIGNEDMILQASYLLGKIKNLKGQFRDSEKLLSEAVAERRETVSSEKYLPVLFELGRTKYFLLAYNEAYTIFSEIEKAGKENGFSGWRAVALDAMGAIHYVRSNFEQALKCHIQSLNLYQTIEDNIAISGLLYSIGADYNCLSVYDKAIEYYLKAVAKNERLKDRKTLAMSLHAIGMTYQEIKNYACSIEYNAKALDLAKTIQDNYLTSSIYSNMGQVKFAQAQYDSALFYFKKELAIDKRINYQPGIASSLDNIGMVYIKLNDFQNSIQCLQRSNRILGSIDEKWRKTKVLNHLGQYHLHQSNYEISFDYITRSLQNAQKIKAKDLILENLYSMSEYYANTKNYRKAYEYIRWYAKKSDSLITLGSHNIAAMQLRYEIGKQEKQKQLLKNEIQIQGLELEKVKLERWLSFLSMIIFSVISFWSYSRYMTKNKANMHLKKRVKKAIKKQEQQQQIIFHQAGLSSLGELAAGMAHEINQPLQDLRLCAEYIDLKLRRMHLSDSSTQKNITEIYQDIDRIKNIVDHVRVFASQKKNRVERIFQIKPVILDAVSMVSRQYTKNEIEMSVNIKENLGQVSGNPFKLEQLILNLLSNAKDALVEKEYKTAEAYRKKIEITGVRNKNLLILSVSDNGIGLKPEQINRIFNPFYTTKKLGKGTGLGLSIVQEIIDEFSGTKKVSSLYMIGTVVEISLPCYSKSFRMLKKVKVHNI